MARITVEDCLERIPDRFELAVLAAHRARQYAGYADINPADKGHNRAVAALREIARGDIDVGTLRRDYIRSHQLQLSDALPDDGTMDEDTLLLQLIEARVAERDDKGKGDQK
ncbi:DNA-directed RNA polymerase subunit omega [Thalassorhabdomicrobium marinisediminis]|uniref:DNA-directed RNA polymerase subunit omega n=1 Tax=Thalassorhabdomicrobium marinisediminis TaxID=2170577 RepID=A0A2T7FU61_9RHOB|nr:DNA-directed RNA polymerase subunit omega [Thalassorhabdomicrobium marinisediminis]PVA05696.1 DNA-directed RNA polymerase subunit omega [Thalassorhabdomicrobium marinisediminis]